MKYRSNKATVPEYFTRPFLSPSRQFSELRTVISLRFLTPQKGL